VKSQNVADDCDVEGVMSIMFFGAGTRLGDIDPGKGTWGKAMACDGGAIA